MMYGPDFIINGLGFYLTCNACPEQYDVMSENGTTVAYTRLRWGNLTVTCPDVGGELVYAFAFLDEYMGIFKSGEDRKLHLTNAAEAINKWLNRSVV